MVTKCMHHWVLIINLARDLFISLPKVELNCESPFHNRFDTKIKSDLSVRFDIEIKSDPEIGLETNPKPKPNLETKPNHTKIKYGARIRFWSKICKHSKFQIDS